MWIYIVSAVLAVLLVKILTLLKAQRQMIRGLSSFPTHPLNHPVFGIIYQAKSFSEYVKIFQSYIEEKRPRAFVYSVLFRPAVNVVHPDLVKRVLSAPARDAPKNRALEGPYRMLLPWLGDGLLVSGGDKWDRNRKLLTPAFHFDILKQYIPVYNTVSDIFLEKIWRLAEGGRSVDICPLVSLATLDTMLRCSLSYTDRVQEEGEKHPYVLAVHRLTHLLVKRAVNPLHYPDWLYQLSSDGKEFKRLCDYVHEFASNIITKRRRELETAPGQPEKRRLDFLDILLTARDEDGAGLTDLEIRQEVDTFMFEGHDTTASAVSWAVYSLGQYPGIQERVREEVQTVLGDREEFQMDDLSRLPYLTCFIKETMRMHSTVPAITRMLTAPLTLDGATLQPGTLVDIFFCLINHNPVTWPDHTEFRPERFLPENLEGRDPFVFTPFSAGQRNCIGQHFAMNEMKIILSRLVTRFHVAVDESRAPVQLPELVMRAVDGLHLTFREL